MPGRARAGGAAASACTQTLSLLLGFLEMLLAPLPMASTMQLLQGAQPTIPAQACHRGNDQQKHLQALISTPFLTPNIPPFLSVFSQYIQGSCCVTRPGVACPIIHTPKQEGRMCVILMEN